MPARVLPVSSNSSDASEKDTDRIRRLEDWLRILSRAARSFAEATTDYQQLLELIARTVAEVVKDGCTVRMPVDGAYRAVALCAPIEKFIKDEAALARARAWLASPISFEEYTWLAQVMERGEPQLVRHLDRSQLRSPEAAWFFETVGAHSVLTVPLRVRGESIGYLALARFAPGSAPYDEHDLSMAQALADHAALAIANARSYAAEREARAAAEAAAKASKFAERRFARLSESGLIGVLVGDNRGFVTEVNDAMLDMLGYTRDEILSGVVSWKSLTPPEHRPSDERALDQLAKTGVGDLREKEYIRKDGRRVPVLVGTAMLEGETTRSISFVLDMTERKAAAAAIAQLREERATNATMRELVESAPDALVLIDRDGKIVLANERVEAVFGHSREEIVGQSIEMLVPARFRGADDVDRSRFFEDATSRAMAEKMDLFGLRKDGSEFPIEVNVAPLETDQGLLVSNAIRDITERKKSEEQRARLAALVDSSADAIIGKTLDGVITSWNRGAEETFGYTAAEAIGKSILLIVPPDRRDEEPLILSEVARGEVKRFDTVRRHKDGRLIDVSVTISPVRDAAAKVVSVSKVARNITDRRRGETALAHAKDVAEAASRELEAFSYSVAHDLRAPLRGMNGFAQVLLDDYGDKLDAQGREWLLEIVVNAQKMGGLIDALLALSRVSRSDVHRDPVDLSEVARSVMAGLRSRDPARAIDVVIHDGLLANADPTLVRSLLDNLLGNAWKFTGNVAAARIEVGCTEQNGTKAFFVRDNGAGFDMAYATKLFAPFQRLHSANEFPGTGIGLATVQRIVRRHGGELWAEGAVDVGATFYFTFDSRNSRAAV